jgi:hypothetical protein
MSIPTATQYPSARSGKPINLQDQATVQGFVTAVSGTGPAATVTIQLAGSGLSVNVQAQDVGATTQTL